MPAARATARRSDDDGRRSELIAAASRVIAQHGIAAATTRRIAEEAGVPPGLVHYWFSGKDELLEAVIADTTAAIEAAVDESRDSVAASATDPVTPLYEQLRAAFRTVESDDRGRQLAMYEMTTWALRKPGLASVARGQYEAYRRITADGLAASGIDPATEPALVELVAAVFDGLTLSWLADPDGTHPDAVLRALAELVASTRVST